MFIPGITENYAGHLFFVYSKSDVQVAAGSAAKWLTVLNLGFV